MSELKEVLDQYAQAFEEYKKTNDARYEELKKGTGKAGELEEKLSKIEASLAEKEKQISDIEAKMNRPSFAGTPSEDPVKAEHKKAFDVFLRKGIESGLADLQKKAVQVGVDVDGGYAVPEEMSREIYKLIDADSSMREVCGVRLVGTEDIKQLVDVGGVTTGWVAETAARPETNSPQLVQVTPTFGEIYAMPAATQKAIDDVFFDVEGWLVDSVASKFAKEENAAFTAGDGTNKPKGILAATMATTDDDTRAFGTFQYLATGVAAGMPTTNPADLLINLITALKSRYYGNARFMMNRQTLATIRKWKDSQNNYLWQPGLQSGEPNSILGFPYTYNDDMPSIGANAICIAFGDFREAYIILDRTGIRLLRDPYTNKPYVNFYITKRVGNMILNTEAVKFIKCEA